jgi:hypothetical protein
VLCIGVLLGLSHPFFLNIMGRSSPALFEKKYEYLFCFFFDRIDNFLSHIGESACHFLGPAVSFFAYLFSAFCRVFVPLILSLPTKVFSLTSKDQLKVIITCLSITYSVAKVIIFSAKIHAGPGNIIH